MGNVFGKLMGAPSRKSIARQEANAKAAAEAAKPARPADEGRDDTGAVVLEGEGSDVNTTATDVAVVTGKKAKRKGVPGLGL